MADIGTNGGYTVSSPFILVTNDKYHLSAGARD